MDYNKFSIDKILSDNYDTFGREYYIQRILLHLSQEQDYRHLCLNGQWGSGKTVIINDIANRLEKNKHQSAFIFNAWKYENYEDPILALISALKETTSKNNQLLFEKFSEKYKDKFNLNFEVSFQVPGFSVSAGKETESINPNHNISAFFNLHAYYDELEVLLMEAIQAFKNNGSGKFVLFIDELDRCKPSFAMALIERFHHLRNIEGVTIVYVVDMDQFKEIVKHHYGLGYNSDIFFQKTFEKILTLPRLDKNNIKKYLKSKNGVENSVDYLGSREYYRKEAFTLLEKYFEIIGTRNVTLRSLNHIVEKVNDIIFNDLISILNTNYGISTQDWIIYPRVYIDFLYFLIILDEIRLVDVFNVLKMTDLSFIVDFVLNNKNVGFTDYVWSIGMRGGKDVSEISREDICKYLEDIISYIHENDELYNAFSMYFI